MTFPRLKIIGYKTDKTPLVLNEIGEREEIGYVFLREWKRVIDQLSQEERDTYLKRLAVGIRPTLPEPTTRAIRHAERMKQDDNPANQAVVVFLTALGLHPDPEFPINRWVVDVLVGDLVWEVDGHFHHIPGASERDSQRDDILRSYGLRVVRIPVWELYRDPLKAISDAVARCL